MGNTFIKQFGGQELTADELTVDKVKELMTAQDWQQLSAMTRDHNLYQNLVQSMFPTIHGNYYSYMNCMASLYTFRQ